MLWPFLIATAIISPASVYGADTSIRNLCFPVAKSMGTLSLPFAGHPEGNANPVGSAFSTVRFKVPKNQLVKLTLNTEAFRHPGDIDLAPATGIDVLEAAMMSMDDREGNACDVVVAKCGHFKDLQDLDLSKSDASDAGVAKITSLPRLEWFAASVSEVKGPCFKNFSKQFPGLKAITILDNQLDNQSLGFLSSCKYLHDIDFRRSRLNNDGMRNLCRVPNLDALNISNNPGISDECIKFILTAKKLKMLDVSGTKITLAGLRQLKPLHLLYIAVSEDKAKDIAELRTIASAVNVISKAPVSESNRKMFAPLHAQ